MNWQDKFSQDVAAKQDEIKSVLVANGIIDVTPTVEKIFQIKATNMELFAAILSIMYGEEFDEWNNTANANGEGASKIIDSASGFFATLMSPLTGLNDAIASFGSSTSSNTNSEALASMNASLEAAQEKASRYRIGAIVAVSVCVVIGLVLIFRR